MDRHGGQGRLAMTILQDAGPVGIDVAPRDG